MWREELTRRFPALASLPAGAYVVGGAIRDLLLGREPADVDVAAPDARAAAETLGRKVIQLGTLENLRAYRVVDGDRIYDFADLLENDLDVDLRRRDFTMNAMAVDLERDVLIDPHGGQSDVAAKVVRMVEAKNFDDDPLRTLKAVRMAVVHRFTIEPATLAAIRERAQKILEVAPERVTSEVMAIFSSKDMATAVDWLYATGLDDPLFGTHNMVRGVGVETPLVGALCILVDDPQAYAERWRWSTALLRDVQTMDRLISTVGEDLVALYDAGEQLARALPDTLATLGLDHDVTMPDFTIRALLTGEEIASITGLPAGKELGAIKRRLLEAQIRGEVKSRAEAEAFVRRPSDNPTP